MELWIRSQDRQELYLIKDKLYLAKGDLIQTSITPYETEQHYEIRYNCGDEILGEYKSKERALEVLDEIQRLITDLQYMSYAIPNDKFTGYRPNVYEMPEE